MREGTRLYLTNDFRSAETLFHRGMHSDLPTSVAGTTMAEGIDDGSDDAGEREELEGSIDLRGAFALQYAIVGLLRGVASMEGKL